MPAESDLSPECRRLLKAFGYRWKKGVREWVNGEAGSAISHETVRAWTLDQLRDWLTKGAARGK